MKNFYHCLMLILDKIREIIFKTSLHNTYWVNDKLYDIILILYSRYLKSLKVKN